ncbi:hypothetical protein, partial [Accumulibacter sp.]|uniref:hypothetical protein n=1 Tax=Accumulibacter sp. TaxID=2053492 RepID=UPI00262C8961
MQAVDYAEGFFGDVKHRLGRCLKPRVRHVAAAGLAILIRPLVHPARLHHRPTLLTLEHGNFVPQLPNGFGLLQHLFLQFGVLG